MRYFIDAEFNGFGGELISIAALPEHDDEPPFYEAINCIAPVPWVRANVLPVLQTKPKPLADVARLFSSYLASDPEPVLIADWPEDIAHAASLLTDRKGGRMLHTAVRFDLISSDGLRVEALSQVPHNAYHDAAALRDWVLARG